MRNRSLSPQQVTVSLRSNGITTFTHEETIGPTDTVQYEQVVSTPGTYRVNVTSSFDRRAKSQWEVERPTQTLVVRFSRDGALSLGNWIRCPVDCGEFVVRTRTNQLSETLAAQRENFPLPAVLILHPAARSEYEAEIQITTGESTILDARYRVQSKFPLAVPITTQSGRYDVTIEVDESTSKYRWHVAEPTELRVIPRDSGPDISAFVRPHPEFSPQDVVSIQLAALRNNDQRRNVGIRTVWRFAAPRTKRRFEQFENFARVLRHPAYAPLFQFEQFEFGATERRNSQLYQPVTITGDDIDPATYEFNLVSSTSLTDDELPAWTTSTFFRVSEAED